jgi:hypothetical protein
VSGDLLNECRDFDTLVDNCRASTTGAPNTLIWARIAVGNFDQRSKVRQSTDLPSTVVLANFHF